jgi:hypothetical protein
VTDWTGSFELVDPRLVVVDRTYQRDLKQDRVDRIASNLDWAKFGAISCARRGNGGTLYVVDGQQRTAAAKQAGVERIPAIIFARTKVEQEAADFVVVNRDRASVNPFQMYRARLRARDPIALGVQKVVNEEGFSVVGSGSSDERGIAAISELMTLYAGMGEEGLRSVLAIIRNAWLDLAYSTSAGFLHVVALLLTEVGETVSHTKIVAELEKTNPSELRKLARGLRHDAGGTYVHNLRRALVKRTKLPIDTNLSAIELGRRLGAGVKTQGGE